MEVARLFGAALLILLAAGAAPAANLRGVVWAQDQRVVRARVTLEQDGAIVGEQYTDSRGAFRFTGLNFPRYELVVSYPGFLTARRLIWLRMVASESYVDFFLQAEPKKKKEAGQSTVDVKELEQSEAAPLLQKASRQMAAGKHSEAIQTLRQALEQKPDDARVHEALGLALMKANRLPEAIEILQKAARLGAHRAQLYLAAAYNSSNLHLEAELAAQEAVAAEPSSWEAWYELGRALYHQGRLEEAERSYQRALEPKSSAADHAEPHPTGRVHLGLGNLYVKAERFPLAAEHLRKFLKEEPQAPETARVRQLLKEMESAGVLRNKP